MQKMHDLIIMLKIIRIPSSSLMQLKMVSKYVKNLKITGFKWFKTRINWNN